MKIHIHQRLLIVIPILAAFTLTLLIFTLFTPATFAQAHEGIPSDYQSTSQHPINTTTTPDFLVNTNEDSDDGSCDEYIEGVSNCTLREAINAANLVTDTNTIGFAGNYTITLTGELPAITTKIQITGNGITNTIVQASSCNPVTLPGGCTPAEYRILSVSDSGDLSLYGLTIRHGYSFNGYWLEDGGAILSHGTLTIDNCAIRDNKGNVGGIESIESRLTVTDSYISGNYSEGGQGGGIFSQGPLTVTNTTFTENFADNAGGALAAKGTTTISDSTFFNNSSTSVWGGGAMLFQPAAPDIEASLHITGCRFISNTAINNHGGAIFYRDSADLDLSPDILSNNVFLENKSSVEGGAIYHIGATTNDSHHLEIANSSFISNTAGTNGGAIANYGNCALSSGHTFCYSHLMITGSAFTGNSAANGGALSNISNSQYNSSSETEASSITTMEIENSTISGNSASIYGGAIYADATYNFQPPGSTLTSILTATNVTIVDNTAADGGGMAMNNQANDLPVVRNTLQNSILYGNTITNVNGPNCLQVDESSTQLNLDANNLLEDVADDCAAGTSDVVVDAELDSIVKPLSDYGGPTETRALPIDSPALNAANDTICTLTDQRGVDRPQAEHCDIGAFEAHVYQLTANTQGDGSGSITSIPAGIDCGADCSKALPETSVITLTASADLGYLFYHWDGDCTGNTTCVLPINADKTVTATFTLIEYPLTVSLAGNGSGSVTSNPVGIYCGDSCSHNFDTGTVVTLTAHTDTDSVFTGWDGACTGTDDCVLTIEAASSVTATFELEQYPLTVSLHGNGNGSVTSDPPGIDCGDNCSHDFAHGTTVTLSAVADTGSVFAGWDGVCTGTDDCVLTIEDTASLTANFILEELEYRLFFPFSYLSIDFTE